MIDSHTHLQPHGEQPPMTRARIDEYVRVAGERGLEAVCITEHLFRFSEAYDLLRGWWDDDPDPRLASLAERYWRDHVSGSVADYVRLIEHAKSAGVPVLLGLEMDWVRGREEDLRAFLAPYDWDIVLGSVHYIGSWGFDEPAFDAEWRTRDVAAVWHDYGALVRDLATSGLADVLAHPDVVKVFGHRPADETPLHDEILGGAAVHGMALELNSNGLNKPVREIYPAPSLLQRAQALGLPITFGSDAHTPDRVGESFGALADLAAGAGYREAVSFVGRAPHPSALRPPAAL